MYVSQALLFGVSHIFPVDPITFLIDYFCFPIVLLFLQADLSWIKVIWTYFIFKSNSYSNISFISFENNEMTHYFINTLIHFLCLHWNKLVLQVKTIIKSVYVRIYRDQEHFPSQRIFPLRQSLQYWKSFYGTLKSFEVWQISVLHRNIHIMYILVHFFVILSIIYLMC